jgi:hypothetical protein
MTTKTKKTTSAAKPPATKAPTRGRPAKAKTTPPVAKDAARADTAAPKAKPVPKGKPPKPAHVSALSAAVLVLASAPAEGLSAKAMIEQMVAQKLWASPKGKTPEASLYAAITREIGRKGKAARFRKVDRGRFVLTQPPA